MNPSASRGRTAARLHPTQRQIQAALRRVLQSDTPAEQAVLQEPALIHAPLQVLLALGERAAKASARNCH